VILANWKNLTLTGANFMPTKPKKPETYIFSEILSIESLIEAIDDGTISQNEIVEHLEGMHKRMCLLISDPSFNTSLQENPNAS
jgi:hypothetical protein